MTTNDEIRLLSQRFYAGETNEEEEALLREITATATEGCEHFETRIFFECCAMDQTTDQLGTEFDAQFRSRLKVTKIRTFRRKMIYSSAAAVLLICSAFILVFSDVSIFGQSKGIVIDNANADQYEEESVAATLDALEILSSSLSTADEQLQTLGFIESANEAAEDINLIAASATN